MSDEFLIVRADAQHIPLADCSVQCVVTSPPYFGLRRYDCNSDDAFGREKNVAEYVSHSVKVLREIRRVLRDNGVVFWNISDSMRKKQLCLIPQRVAVAAHDDGWVVRDQIIWHKANPMPESVRDRYTRSYEPILMLTKSPRYFWNAEAIKEPSKYPNDTRKSRSHAGQKRHPSGDVAGVRFGDKMYPFCNPRNVWTFPTQPYKAAHFATFPEELPRRCILAASTPGDVVLDPFGGSGTTAKVAVDLGRHVVSIDLAYHDIARERVLAR